MTIKAGPRFRAWKRAILLYKRYHVETREYEDLAQILCGSRDIGALNLRIWEALYKGKY